MLNGSEQVIAEMYKHCRELTNRFQVVPLMGVFVQEEVIASRILRDPFWEICYLCGVRMYQLNDLLFKIQFLINKGEKGAGET